MTKSHKEYIIDTISPNSPLIYAIRRKSWFRTYIELYDTRDHKGKAIMLNRVLRANSELRGRLKAIEFLENNTYPEVILGVISIPNRLSNTFIEEFEHQFKYLELTYPNSILVTSINELRKIQQNLTNPFHIDSRRC